MPAPEQVLERLACPRCHGSLSRREAALLCRTCRIDYPVINGVHDLRLPDTQSKDEAVDWFAASLGQQDRGWFASHSDRETLEAAAHGIRVIGTPRALETLRGLAGSKDRHVRAACQKELGSLGA